MVKKLVSVLCICAYFGLAHAQIPQEIWKESEQIEKQIKKTSFPDRVYNIKDFGAKEGNNGEILCHEAINLAILTCSQTGGGTVLVPPGEFLTGPITLKSNVNLHLEEGAYLKFSSEKYLYTPTVLTRWEGVDCYNLHPLIYAYGESNIGITGKGIIDGQASNDNWCIIRKSKFPQNPKRSVRFSGKRTKRSVQKRKARNTQKAETKVL